MSREWRPNDEVERLLVLSVHPDVMGRMHPGVLEALFQNGGRLPDALTVMIDRGLTDKDIWAGDWLALFVLEARLEARALLADLRAQHRVLRAATTARGIPAGLTEQAIRAATDAERPLARIHR